MISWLDANFITILNGLQIGVLLFTLAAGLSLIFGLMDVFNLAHGAIFLFGTYMALQLATDGRVGLAAVVAAVAVGAGLGAGLFASLQPIANRGHLDHALLTFGIGFVLQDVISLVWGDDYLALGPPRVLDGSVEILGHTYPTYRLAVIVAGLVIAAALYVLVERTQLGAIVRAAVADRGMASALGIRVNLVFVAIFVLGSALAAFGGVIGAPILGVRPGLDVEILVLALIVVVIGGLGSLKGAIVGALLIGEAQALGPVLVPELAPFILFGVMALVLLVRPSGLFGDASHA